MPAPKEILDLVARFGEHLDGYHNGKYNETQLRRDYLDPFLKALGWDVDNTQGHAEAYREVVHEDAVKIGGNTKSPDYSCRIGGTRKFFVEAKKPSVDIKGEPAPAFQLRRYAWSAKLPLSILTDFEEFAVYDCRIRPSQNDKAATARIHYFKYNEYPEKWDEIAAIFSKEAVLKGSFDKYAATAKGKKGTTEVDSAFLDEIEGWREALAKDIARNNEELSQRALNWSVQQTIDRIIFLRIAEDRGIEPEQLRGLQNGTNVYSRLKELFQKADDRYNSGLFHFKKEPDRLEEPDRLTPGLVIEDKTLKDIFKHLYYPDSPYEFSVLGADILGSVYERFLGKVIRLTAGHHAKIEEKPEVKKAGGVYYTPTYIVDYIVKHTVGKLLEGKTPKEAEKLRILDPACGSGSFLIGAYQYLLDWHRDWYVNDGAEKHARGKSPRLHQGRGGGYRLTTAERKRILVNNLYGVDIDSQAVEVTKLSLLLKVLEGETQLEMFHERVLPDLGSNIKCGNSLVGTDFYQVDLFGQLSDEEMSGVNAFDWDKEFSLIMKGGGFDVVIGNPPYAYRNATEESLRPYYAQKYISAEGNFDLYKFFIERGVGLCRTCGYMGLIVSATFLVQPSFTKLREFLLQQTSISELNPLGPNVFDGATVDTVILITQRENTPNKHLVKVKLPKNPSELNETKLFQIPQERFMGNEKHVLDVKLSDAGHKLIKRLTDSFPPIEDGYEFGVGINTGFIRDELVADSKLDDRYHPMVAGTGISRYGAVVTSGWIMYDRDFVRSKGKLGRSLPSEHLFTSKKILVVRTRNLSLERRIVSTIDEDGAYNLNRLSNIISRPHYSLSGLLGILNSSLFNWIFSTRFFDYEIKPVYLRQAPMADVNNERLVRLVDQMLVLSKQLAAASTPHEQESLKRQIDATDRQIDKLVYELYGLTDEEIKIVEGE